MPEAPDSLPVVPTLRRPWYRLHRSTWIVVLLVLAVLVLVVVPGEPCGGLYSRAPAKARHWTQWEIFEHGWPWMFLERDRNCWRKGGSSSPLATEHDDAGAGWYDRRSWSLRGDSAFFFPSALIADLAIVSLILAAVAYLTEWRRRRLERFFQYTLAQLMLVVALTACLLSFWCVHRNQHRMEAALAAQLKPMGGVFIRDGYRGPLFLRKLIGGPLLDDFRVVTECQLFEPDNEDAAKQAFTTLCRFGSLESVSITPRRDWGIIELPDVKSHQYGLLKGCERLRRLELKFTPINDADVDELGTLVQLKELDVGVFTSCKQLNQLRQRLPNCNILADECIPDDESANIKSLGRRL